MKRIQLIAIVLSLTVASLADAAKQPNDVEFNKFTAAMESLATEIAQYINTDKEAGGALHVGAFQGPSEGGPVITLHLAKSLGSMVEVSRVKKGNYFVNGDYSQLEDEGRFYTVITATIRNKQGKEMNTFPRRLITDQRVAIELFQPPSLDNTEQALPKNEQHVRAGEDARTKPIYSKKRAAENLAATLTQTPGIAKPPTLTPTESPTGKKSSVARFSATSPYGVELLVKDKNASVYGPSTLEIDKSGIALAEMGSDQVYAIRIHNDTDQMVSVSITIDGINIFHFSENDYFRTLGKVVINPGGGMLKGWHKVGKTVNEFQVAEYGETAAAELGASSDLGTMTVTFFPAVQSKSFGTARGKEIDGQMKSVHAKISNDILGAVSLSYLKKGIARPDLPNF